MPRERYLILGTRQQDTGATIRKVTGPPYDVFAIRTDGTFGEVTCVLGEDLVSKDLTPGSDKARRIKKWIRRGALNGATPRALVPQDIARAAYLKNPDSVCV